MVLLDQNSDHLVLRLCKEFSVTTAVWITSGCCIAHVRGKSWKNHVASAIVGARNERFRLILLNLLRFLSLVEKSAPVRVGRFSAGAKMAVAKWLLSRWQPDFLRVSSGCSSFSLEHHETAKICLHKSVRPSVHLCLCCSCQQRRDVWLAAPPRC